jgi:hypothetical protein
VVDDGGQEEILNTRQLRSLKNTKTGKKGRGGFLPGLAFQLWNSYEFFFSRSFWAETADATQNALGTAHATAAGQLQDNTLDIRKIYIFRYLIYIIILVSYIDIIL